MGSKTGPNYTCLFVGYVEEQIMRQYTGFIPQLHKRYVDDVVGIAHCSRVQLDDFINFVSSFHPALQFTHITKTELPFLDIKLRVSGDHISSSICYKDTDSHSYLHHLSSHPRHCKGGLPYSQLLRFRRLCSDGTHFFEKAMEMKSFFEMRGYSPASVEQDLEKERNLHQRGALQKNTTVDNANRIPLVLTYHPLNNRIKRILLDNFSILTNDPATNNIFPEPPLFAYRRDQNLRGMLVNTADRNLPNPRPGSFPCHRARCRTCQHITADTNLPCPNCSIKIKESFTCQISNLIYCISCRRCQALYIGETGRTLRERFGEHLRSVTKNMPGFPVAEHFNNHGHSLYDADVRGVKLCDSNKQRKRQEMRLIFKIGTSQPRGLNSDFRFL